MKKEIELPEEMKEIFYLKPECKEVSKSFNIFQNLSDDDISTTLSELIEKPKNSESVKNALLELKRTIIKKR
jgi:hypothetical protein